MKRIISILISAVIIILCFSSCGSTNQNDDNSDKTKLTLENYNDYISISAKYGPKSYNYTTDIGENITCSASVESASASIKFYNCVIKVRIKGSYKDLLGGDKVTTDDILEIKLNIGGTGNASKVVESYGYDIKGLGYDVISVSGYIDID